MLAIELRARVLDHPLRLCGESDHEDAVLSEIVAQRTEDVDGGHQLEAQDVRSLLELVRCHLARTPVGHRRGHDEDARARERVTHSGVHLGRGFHGDHLEARLRVRRGCGCHQRDRRAEPQRRRGDLVPHSAAGPIADEAHRVDRFTGSTGGDHETKTGDAGVRPRRQGWPSPQIR